MARQAFLRKKHMEKHLGSSGWRDFILGWQDGLVNVLGVTLGVATATSDLKIILTAAFAATFAESISMGAVAYTSFTAEADFYQSERNKEAREIKDVPDEEKKEIRKIYSQLGFKGSLLNTVVEHIVSNKKRWLDVMMAQELKLSAPKRSPLHIAWIVGLSALIGSLIPIFPFFFLPVHVAVWTSLVLSSVILFFVGAYKAKTTVGSPWKSGLQMMLIGMLAALAGFGIGALFGVAVH
ncbi:VIT1/CCC1 transporter family protein [Candidatus Woesearchaeota archaeon]|nr:VIT1/CCC1 transporter family protein [Candidatus Woesearchaeota archaeon]